MDLHGKVDLDAHPTADRSAIDESVPVIDIGSLDQGASAESAIQAIASACEEWGFFQITNHGVPRRIVDGVWAQTKQFFAAPQALKDEVRRTRENPWGYYDNELTKNQRDKKEVFDFTTPGKDGIYDAENRWPAHDPLFQSTMEQYLEAVSQLSLKLLRAFCSGLGLPAEYLNGEFEGNHTGFVRLNYYPVQDPMQGSSTPHHATADMGVHHHTDAGGLTVLLQGDVSGLQVHHDGLWHDVQPVRDAFVINTGDMMQVWSNDRYHAPVHRVLPMHAQDRYSLPFFFNPSAMTRVAPLPTLVSNAAPARYRTIPWSEFRGKRTDGDYADYGTEVQIGQYRL